jgi:4-hydroxythreonine-4-phosphate dehydrogenase
MTNMKNVLSSSLAITMGDPAGIGPEIIVKSFADPAGKLSEQAIVYGDLGVIAEAAQRFAPSAGLSVVHLNDPDEFTANSKQIAVVNCSTLALPIRFGQVDAGYGSASVNAIKRAVQNTMALHHHAIVTAPIHKEAIAAAGVTFPGHTEMLAAWSNSNQVRMMLANQELRTVLVTIHVSLAQAIEQITQAQVAQTIAITAQALRNMGLANPRIAVAGLNPHAGEGGLFGREEIEHIAPAIEQQRALGIDVQGPFAGDTIFAKARGFAAYDAVIAMYHDQGLIPVKYLGIEQGVNVTLGLPFIRTSVDHGTAFDIAGQGIADHRSLLAAADWATQQLSNQSTP